VALCANGQQLKCLTVTDEWTKEGLAIEVDGRLRSGRAPDGCFIEDRTRTLLLAMLAQVEPLYQLEKSRRYVMRWFVS
jgi:hypothetical protein